MKIVSSIHEWQQLRANLAGKIGFVPTMGNLHAGHVSLYEASLNENDVTVVSIFVNPTQFNQADDYVHYPRTLAADITLLEEVEVDFVLTPSVADIYPDDHDVTVSEEELSTELEGVYRPGHFNGVLTVIAKFLNCIQPHRIYMGEKDYQQILLVKKLIHTMLYPTELIACPTIREASGLAMSSRNNRLDPGDRAYAAKLYAVLRSGKSLEEMRATLTTEGFKVDYIEEKWGRILAAVWINGIRLIDNV